MRKAPLLILIGILAAVAPAPGQLLSKKALSWEAVKKVAAAAEERARKDNWNVAITILDEGANLLYFQRMDGVQIGSIQVSIRKAESAIKFKRPGKARQSPSQCW